MTKSIPLTQGKFALVDDEDYEWLSQWKWCFDGRYAKRRVSLGKYLYLHRAIINTPDNKDTDHINGNKLDCRRINLRICSRAQNIANIGIRKNNHCGVKGVYLHKCGKWHARIKVDGTIISLGYFNNKNDAGKAYTEAAHKYYGDFCDDIQRL